MSDEFDWVHRDRGILTERDREILVGESGTDLSQNAVYQRLYNIRNRVENSLYDFYLLAQYLPHTDKRYIFEHAYKWARKRRDLNSQGLTSTSPDLSPFLWSWLSLFQFFSYGMYAGGMKETQPLMEGLIENGIERGYRQYQHENFENYREVAASFSVDYGNLVRRDNYLRGVENNLPNEPSDIAERVMNLYFKRKIPRHVANHWIEKYVQSPNLDH